jgi:hypothetical protein
MNLSIIYIFALFVIFSPHFLSPFLQKNKYAFLIYSLLFSIVFYFTFDIVTHKEIEGALLTTYDIYGNQEKVDVTNVNLGDVQLDNGFTSLVKPNKIIYTESAPTQPAGSPPSLFNRYALEENINKLFQHHHDETYKQNIKEVLCAADYGKKTACCDQPPANVPDENVCPEIKPYCIGYVEKEKWGRCSTENRNAPPNFTFKPKEKEKCLDKENICKTHKRCCPGGPGSDSNVKCGTEDCPIEGKTCVGTWMKENCPKTCGLCERRNDWDGDISGYYIAEKSIEKNDLNFNDYVSINKLYGNEFAWNNRAGSNWKLKRYSNTNSFEVSNYPENQWSMTRVVLDNNNKVLSILGPGNQLFTKQYYIKPEPVAPAPEMSIEQQVDQTLNKWMEFIPVL